MHAREPRGAGLDLKRLIHGGAQSLLAQSESSISAVKFSVFSTDFDGPAAPRRTRRRSERGRTLRGRNFEFGQSPLGSLNFRGARDRESTQTALGLIFFT